MTCKWVTPAHLWSGGFGAATDGLVVNAIGPDADASTLHLFAYDGVPGRSWTSSLSGDPDNTFSVMAAVGAGGPNTFAAVTVPSYEITRVSGPGTVERFRREADWFEPWPHVRGGRDPRSGRRLPRAMALHVLSDGRLVILVGQEAEDPPPDTEEFDPTTLGQAWDTRVELLDLDAGRVAGSLLHPEYFVGMADDTLLYSLSSDENGAVVADLWKLVLPSPEPVTPSRK